jgi:hypothetical protein
MILMKDQGPSSCHHWKKIRTDPEAPGRNEVSRVLGESGSVLSCAVREAISSIKSEVTEAVNRISLRGSTGWWANETIGYDMGSFGRPLAVASFKEGNMKTGLSPT